MRPDYELVWQEDMKGHAVPTMVLVINDVEALVEERVLSARNEFIANQAVTPERIDLTIFGPDMKEAVEEEARSWQRDVPSVDDLIFFGMEVMM